MFGGEKIKIDVLLKKMKDVNILFYCCIKYKIGNFFIFWFLFE